MAVFSLPSCYFFNNIVVLLIYQMYSSDILLHKGFLIQIKADADVQHMKHIPLFLWCLTMARLLSTLASSFFLSNMQICAFVQNTTMIENFKRERFKLNILSCGKKKQKML